MSSQEADERTCRASSFSAPIPGKRSHKFHIIENYFILEILKKKIWANFDFSKNYRTFYSKNSH
jgi:hypothetical protein